MNKKNDLLASTPSLHPFIVIVPHTLCTFILKVDILLQKLWNTAK